MSEEILNKLSQQIGELNGTVKTHIKAQEKINEALTREVKGLNATKNKFLGASLLGGTFTAGIFLTLSKLFKFGGQ